MSAPRPRAQTKAGSRRVPTVEQDDNARRGLVLVASLEQLVAEMACGPAGTSVKPTAEGPRESTGVPKMFAGGFLHGPSLEDVIRKTRRIGDMLAVGHSISDVQKQMAEEFEAGDAPDSRLPPIHLPGDLPIALPAGEGGADKLRLLGRGARKRKLN
jgi:hypothetical protein